MKEMMSLVKDKAIAPTNPTNSTNEEKKKKREEKQKKFLNAHLTATNYWTPLQSDETEADKETEEANNINNK